ncbi:hypothetical protein FRB99_000614 [Tulasnella sp. 403]|nr:hypothetical protein FRB99_000614 [Tulasnella sp. 403]
MAANHLYHTQLHQQMNPIPIAPHPHQQQQQLYPQPHIPQPPLHQSPSHVPRKRPKYSRSKLGCLSCRVRKVKCDETRPICTRCAHSQRECTWPAEVPKSKKSAAASNNAESAPPSRPSTSGAQAPGAASDTDWQSDSGGAGPIRSLSGAGGRASATHSRQSSVSSLRGRDLTMTSSANVSRNASANHSRSRDRSPNPFAFSVSQLGPNPGIPGHHQRSASTSSTASTSSVASLPYPLVAQGVPTSLNAIPGLSTSQTSSPSSAPFTQSPTMAWPPATSNDVYGSRPSTSSSSIVAGLGNIDLNSFGPGNFGVGLDGSGFGPNDNFAFSSSLDASPGFAGPQSYDSLQYGSFDGSMTNGFDPTLSAAVSQDLEASTSFLAQLQQSLGPDGSAYTPAMSDPSISGSSSSGSPDMDMDNLVGSLDPRTLSSSVMSFDQGHPGPGYNSGGGTGSSPQAFGVPTASAPAAGVSGFRDAQTPMAAAGFGLQQSAPVQNQLEAYGIPGQTFGSNTPSNLSEFGTNSNDPQVLPRLQPTPGSFPTMAEYTMSTSNPTSMAYPQASEMMASSIPMASSTPSMELTSAQPMMMSSNTGFGLTSARTLPPHRPSDRSLNPNSGVGAATSTLGSEASSLMAQYSPRSVADEAGAGRFTDAARVGVQADLSSSTLQAGMRTMTGPGRPLESAREAGLELSPSANLRMAGSRLGEAERELSHSETPRPNLLQQRHPMQQTGLPQQLQDPLYDSLSPPTMDQLYQLQGSPPFPPSQQFQPSRASASHARSRSDTITPANVLEMSRLVKAEEDESSPEWGLQQNGEEMAVVPVNGGEVDTLSMAAGQWSTVSPATRHMLSNPDPLEPFFKTVQERNLIRHYCQTSTRLMMALPSSLNPILSIHLPIIMSSPSTALPTTPPLPTLVSPPTSPETSERLAEPNALVSYYGDDVSMHAAIEALRVSLLGVASIHQAYLLAKSGPVNRVRAFEMFQLSRAFRVRASRCLAVAVTTLDGCRSDAALGACVSIALIDIFAGGYNYAPNLELAKALVRKRGGPAAIVRYSQVATVRGGEATSPSFEGPFHFVEAGSGSPPGPSGQKTLKKGVLISSARLLLEYLTVYDTFSTLTSGEQPSLLRPGDSAWWFQGDTSNYHLFSVEKMFGMSRSIVELFARVSGFLNRHRHPPPSSNVLNVQGHMTPNSSRPCTPTPSLSQLSEAPPSPGSPLAPLHAEALALLKEVETWTDTTLSFTAMHPRIKFGNLAHKSALLILLLREAFNLPVLDPRVQKCVEVTLAAALRASADFAMSVDLTWPVVIAGCQCVDGALRTQTVGALEGFRKQCCFEIDTSEQIVSEVWRRMDAGLPRADFRSVIDDLNLRVLIL